MWALTPAAASWKAVISPSSGASNSSRQQSGTRPPAAATSPAGPSPEGVEVAVGEDDVEPGQVPVVVEEGARPHVVPDPAGDRQVQVAEPGHAALRGDGRHGVPDLAQPGDHLGQAADRSGPQHGAAADGGPGGGAQPAAQKAVAASTTSRTQASTGSTVESTTRW